MDRQTAVVIGFNARPIALAAKRFGFRVLAADYWGDTDIRKKVDGLATVLRQQPGEEPLQPSEPVGDLLFEAASRVVQDHGKPDLILLGSGLDDRFDLWKRLGKIAPICGNDVKILPSVRDRIRLFELAEDLGICCPQTIETHEVEEGIKAAKEIGYPVVVKPPTGSGGSGIYLARDQDDIERRCKRRRRVLIQQLIRGVDASSSVLCDGDECVVVTVNEQLIGKKELGTVRPFGYCGNIVPLDAPSSAIVTIEEASKALGEALGLIGTNGFDWVVRSDGTPFLMEINPRFQATLECIEMVTGINVVKAHVEACGGKLPNRKINVGGSVARMIVFATSKGIVGKLTPITDLYDVPIPGVIVGRGDPVCTVQTKGRGRADAIKRAEKVIDKVRGLI